MTEAACSVSRASDSSRSMRAESTAWSDPGSAISASGRVTCQPPGSRTIVPSSTSVRTISSMKNGLPSALSRMRSRKRAGTPPPGTAWSSSFALSAPESGRSSSSVERCG